MSGFSGFASEAFQILGAANTVLGAVDRFTGASGDEYKEQKARNNLSLQNALTDAVLKKQDIALTAQRVESERRDALRRAMAKQKAYYGASGTDSGSGSAQAVLLGKVSESEEDRRQSEALDALKTASIDEGINTVQRINTLQLTQMKQKNKYKKYTSALDLADSFSGFLE